MWLLKKTKFFHFALLIAFLCFSTGESWGKTSQEQKAKSLAYYAVGVVYDLQGFTEEAIEEYQKAAQYNESTAIYLRLGAGYARLGKLSRAIEELDKVLDQDNKNVQARYLLALIYSTQKEFDQAAEQYEAILTSFSHAEPENIEIYGYLAQLYYSQKQYNKAIEQFEVILSFYPNDTNVLFLLGSLYLEIENREKAIELFNKAIRIDPRHDTSLNSLGYVYAENGSKLDEAQRLIERALEVDPENGAYLDSLGWVYYKKGQYEEALLYLKKADNKMKDPVIYEHIGDVYFELNLKDDAKDYWTRSLELLPGQDRILEKIKALQ